MKFEQVRIHFLGDDGNIKDNEKGNRLARQHHCTCITLVHFFAVAARLQCESAKKGALVSTTTTAAKTSL